MDFCQTLYFRSEWGWWHSAMFVEFCFVGPSPQFTDCDYLIRQLAHLWQNCCTLIHHVSYHICSCNSIKWCSTHFAAIKCILNPVTKFAALLNHKFLYGQLITLQLSTCLLPCTVQLYLYEQDQNVQCSARKQVTLPLVNAWTHLAIESYSRAQSPSAWYNTACPSTEFIAWSTAILTYKWCSTLQNCIFERITNTVNLNVKYICTPVHILPNLILSCTSLCHVLWEAYTLFHTVPLVWLPQKNHEWLMWMLTSSRYLSIPPFYGTSSHPHFVTGKHSISTWLQVHNLMCKKRMEILQLHTRINMFCTGIFLNTKDCKEGLLSVNMVYMTLDQIWNGNNFKVLEVKNLK